MLRELHIANLAVIEDARIEFADGLNCFTGQTGAGKSLVLGAFELLLGLRSGADLLRADADEGRVCGLFDLQDEDAAREIAELADISVDLQEGLLVTRKLFASGRTSVSVNGQPATASMVRRIGERLVDIHGQHDHQYLLKPKNQLLILDAAAQTDDLRREFERITAERRALQQRRDELTAGAELRRQQLELYEFQAQEIDAVDPQPGELDELQQRYAKISNIKRLQSSAATAHAALYDSDGAVVERLQVVTQVLLELVEIDQSLRELSEQVRNATLTLQEASYDLSRYADRLELDPEELAHVEDRLNQLQRLITKYADPQRAAPAANDPLEALIQYRETIGERIDALRQANDDSGQIAEQIREHEVARDAIGNRLTDAREQAARTLKEKVEAQLADLHMPDARFEVRFEATDESTRGFDAVEFMIRPNPGQPARPLRKIASGGELSRMMLAIKSILAGRDRVSVLVFDEIDANIGGRLGGVVGRKLRDLCRGGHQILCITHLPQIAAFADRHLHIAKRVEGRGGARNTRTTVAPLDGDARVNELANMMAGAKATATTRKQAKELIHAAVQ